MLRFRHASYYLEEEDERMLEEAFRQEEIREQEEMKYALQGNWYIHRGDGLFFREFLDKFTPAEMDRYEHYRRSRLPKSSVKKVGLGGFRCNVAD